MAHPTNRKWVITPVINGISRLNPLIIGVKTHLRFVGWATKYTFFWGWRLNATFGHWMSLSLQRRLMERTMDSDGKWVVNRGRSTRHVTHALRFLPVSYDISTHSFPRSVTEGIGNGRSLLSCFFVPIPWVCALDFLLSLSHYTRSYPCQKWLVNRLWIHSYFGFVFFLLRILQSQLTFIFFRGVGIPPTR